MIKPVSMTVDIGVSILLIPAGTSVQIAVLTTSPTGTANDVSLWSPFHIHYPDGTLHNLCTGPGIPSGCSGTFPRS